MHKIFILCTLFLYSLLFSQKINFQSDVQVFYNLTFKPDSTQIKTVNDIGVAYINTDKKESIYQASKKKKMDSLIQVMNITKFPSRPMYTINHVIHKDLSNFSLLYTEVVDNINFGYSEFIQKSKWQLENEKKNILDHTCFKANLKFHGRNYTAWYAQDLPISDGPYKFFGLPGVILEIYDNNFNFHYQAVAINNKNIDILYDNNFVKTERKVLRDSKINNIIKNSKTPIKFNPIELD